MMRRTKTWRDIVLRSLTPACLALVAIGCQAPPALNFPPYGSTQVPPPGTGSYGRAAPGVSQRPTGDAYYSRQSAVGSPTVGGVASAAGASAGPSSPGDWRAATSASLTGQAAADSTTSLQGSGQTIPATAISQIEPSALSNSTSVADANKEVVRIVEPSSEALAAASPAPQTATAGGMPVNDGTRLREPRLFSPPPGVIAISQAPAAAVGAATPAPPAASPATVAANPSRDIRGLSATYPVAQVSAEAPIASEPSPVATASAATSNTATSSGATSNATASSAPLGWRVKQGLK